MTHATMYPGSNRTKWLPKFGGITMPKISKLVLHSTESRGLPGYPSFAPQFTFDPWTLTFYQHMPANLSASTLADPTSTAVRENRDDVVQVEIIGYADPQQAAAFQVNRMPAKAIAELGKFVAWLHTEWELPLVSVPAAKWLPYPASYGTRGGARLSGPAYDSFAGVLGHQHVSGNSHGDPGNIDIAGILAAAKAIVAPPKPTPAPATPKPPVFEPVVYRGYSFNGQSETFASTRLKALAFKDRVKLHIAATPKDAQVIIVQEMNRAEMAAYFAGLGDDWSYVRAQGVGGNGLNGLGHRKSVFPKAADPDEWLPPAGGQLARTCIARKLTAANGDRIRTLSTHLAASASDLTPAEAIELRGEQARYIRSHVNDDEKDWPSIIGADWNSAPTDPRPNAPRRLMEEYRWKFLPAAQIVDIGKDAKRNIDGLAANFGAVLTSERVVLLGAASDHDGRAFTFTTTKEN